MYEDSSVNRSLFSAARTMKKTQNYVSHPRPELSESGLSLQLSTRSPGALRSSDLVFYMPSSWNYILVSSFRILQFHNQYLEHCLPDVSFYKRYDLEISNRSHRKPNLDSFQSSDVSSLSISGLTNAFQICFAVLLCIFNSDSDNIS
jgi:hypothetical protein